MTAPHQILEWPSRPIWADRLRPVLCVRVTAAGVDAAQPQRHPCLETLWQCLKQQTMTSYVIALSMLLVVAINGDMHAETTAARKQIEFTQQSFCSSTDRRQ